MEHNLAHQVTLLGPGVQDGSLIGVWLAHGLTQYIDSHPAILLQRRGKRAGFFQ